MSGVAVREMRRELGLSQQEAARRWGVSQAYVSLVEQGKRPVPRKLATTLARRERRFATGLTLEPPVAGRGEDLARRLGALGYPPFAYLGQARDVANPAAVVLAALTAPALDARVAAALPWVFEAFPHLSWPWLVDRAKLVNAQNRLGFLLALAREHAPRLQRFKELNDAADALDQARLFREDELTGPLTGAERRYLTDHRSDLARYWRVVTGMHADDLRYVEPTV